MGQGFIVSGGNSPSVGPGGGSGGRGPEVVWTVSGGDGGRISRDEMFLEMAEVLAKRSTCIRSKVGALVVRGGRIISTGYNGPVSGAPLCSEVGGCLGAGCNRSIHAELNAILFAARAGISVEGCTLYCSLSPCLHCAQAIVNAGITRVVYQEQYRKTEGIEFLMKYLVQVEKYRRAQKPVATWIPYGEKDSRCPVCGHVVMGRAKSVCPYCFSQIGSSDSSDSEGET